MSHQGTEAVILNQQPPQLHQQSAAPAQMTVIYQANASPMEDRDISANYKWAIGLAMGSVQLFCGIASILLNIIDLVLLYSGFGFIGYGIWGGLLFLIPTGILGIVSAKKYTCVIISYMVMSIMSSVVGFVILILGIVSAVFGSPEISVPCAIVGLVELITGIVAASICCAVVCCGRAQQPGNNTNYTNAATPIDVSATPSMGQQQVVPSYEGQPIAYTTTGAQQGYAIAPPVHYPTQPNYLVEPSYPQQQQQYEQQPYAPQQQPYAPQQEPNPDDQQMPPPPEYNPVAGGYQQL